MGVTPCILLKPSFNEFNFMHGDMILPAPGITTPNFSLKQLFLLTQLMIMCNCFFKLRAIILTCKMVADSIFI